MINIFFNKIVESSGSTILLTNLYMFHLIIIFFSNNSNSGIITHDLNCNLYNLFLEFINYFPINIINKEVLTYKISKESFYNLFNDFMNDKHNIISHIKNDNLINIFYSIYSTNKELKHNIKEFNLYFTDLKYINYINNITKNIKVNSVCNLYSGFGHFIYDLYDRNTSYLLVDENMYIVLISYINFLLKYTDVQNIKFKVQNIITEDISNTTYDLVLANLPDDIRNLIYTNCNSKIKSLKIRGTKSEPLIIQYITQILNKTGIAIIKTPNSLLFSDSNQHILTRKYIIEHFGVEVINLNNKKSILIIKKTNIKKILFKFFDNDTNYEYTIEDIMKNKYSFYYYNYYKQIINNDLNKINKINEVIDIITFNNHNYTGIIDNYNGINDILYSYKNNNFSIDNIKNIKNADYIFISKNNSLYLQEYLNNELLVLFNNINKNITKGKMDQLNIEFIKELSFIIPSIDIQNKLIEYNKNNNYLNNTISIQIDSLELLKKKYINETIINTDKIMLSNICNITHETNKKNTIYINRNTINAGCINLTSTDKESTTNNYYLNIFNNNFLHDYLYFILLYYENDFKNIANTNKTISLSRNFIETFNIPILSKETQQEIINKLNQMNSSIHSLLNFKYTIEKPFSLFYQ
jgi:hypothetical protein